MIVALFLCLCFLFCIFYGLMRQYRQNTAYSSASHLIEINRQGAANIGASLARDRSVARDIARETESGGFTGDSDLFSYLEVHRQIWGEDDIRVYTENGLCVDHSGAVQGSGNAAVFAAEVVQEQETFRIIQSQSEFAVAIKSDLKIRGSQIVAVSVIHDLSSLTEDLGIRSFDGKGGIYLTRQNGIKICQDGGKDAKGVYNPLALLENGTLTNLTGDGLSIGEAMSAGKDGVFLFHGQGLPTQYVVLTPVNFMRETLYLFNIVPQSIVNQTLNEYSRNIVLLSLSVIILTIVIFAVFFEMYSRSSRKYDAALHSREHLFDLLVSQTRNAFMLLEEGGERPAYLSSNLRDILQEDILRFQKDGAGYRLIGSAPAGDSRVLEEINRALSGWDGRQEFVSGYLPCACIGGPGTEYVRLSLSPALSRPGEFIGIIQDVTPEYRRENSLREALTLADSANRAKTQFLSSVSHDIRTPLNAIINMARFLRRELAGSGKPEEQIEVIQQSSQHLLNLINDVLDMSRIESGKLSFTNAPFSMESALNKACEIIRPLCTGKGQHFLYVRSPISHPRLVGDELRLNQILINILNNAVKFTPQGGEIEFSVEELTAIKAGSIPFRFTVRDTGIGIPAEKLSSIFDPFARVESRTVRETEGSGLGLAITKRFVDALGGSVSVRSTVGAGSVFTVELTYALDISDAAPQAVEKAEDASACRFDGRRALLAEDNDINREIAVTILSEWGLEVESAENGQQALELFRGHPAGYYDIIYMDIQMPVLDGYGAAEAIRALEREDAAAVPVIAMTANAFAEDVEHARSAGMSAHVAKPIDPSELRRVTARFLGGGKQDP